MTVFPPLAMTWPAPGIERSLDASSGAVAARHDQRVAGFDCHGRLLRRLHAGGETDLARLVGREAHDDHLVHRAGEYFPRELHAAGV